MELVINGQAREFASLPEGSNLGELIQTLGLKGDRVAVEYKGAIVARQEWSRTTLENSARLEIVHFVGGGVSAFAAIPGNSSRSRLTPAVDSSAAQRTVTSSSPIAPCGFNR